VELLPSVKILSVPFRNVNTNAAIEYLKKLHSSKEKSNHSIVNGKYEMSIPTTYAIDTPPRTTTIIAIGTIAA